MPLRKTAPDPAPKTPGTLLAEAIDSLGIGKSAAGRRIGVPYYRVHRWTQDREFTPKNQETAALGLGLSPDAFSAPTRAEERELERQRAFLAFLRRPIAKSLPPEVRRVLESVRFVDDAPRPTVAFYEVAAGLLLGQVTDAEAAELADYNAALDLTPPPKRR